MNKTFVEQDCCITHEGKEFCSGGAVVTDKYAIGYMSDDMRTVTTWHGELLGVAKVISSWWIHSWMGTNMYQVEATIQGVCYTGRTLGGGTIWRGKSKARQ